MKKDYPVQEIFEISDLKTLKIITHPQRIEIIQALSDPKTVKEIAAEIGADPTKLYYHMRQLEGADLIQVVETKVVSGILEKTYLVSAKSYKVDEGLFTGANEQVTGEDLTNVVNALVQNVLHHAKRSIEAGILQIKSEEPHDPTNRVEASVLALTKEQAILFNQKINEMEDEFKRWINENEANGVDKTETKDYLWTKFFFPMATDSDR